MEGARAPVGLRGAASFVAMSVEREFDVVIVAEPEGGYSVFVPELPSVATQGETIGEARANAQEAIEGYLEVVHDRLPIPTVHRDRVADSGRVSQTPAVSGKQLARILEQQPAAGGLGDRRDTSCWRLAERQRSARALLRQRNKRRGLRAVQQQPWSHGREAPTEPLAAERLTRTTKTTKLLKLPI